MQTAIENETGKIVHAFYLQSLVDKGYNVPTDFRQYKGQYKCPVCEHPVFFRVHSVGARETCFVAFPKGPECENHKRGNKSQQRPVKEDQEPVTKTTTGYELVLGEVSIKQEGAVKRGGKSAPPGTVPEAGHGAGPGEPKSVSGKSRLSLKTVLRNLIKDPDYLTNSDDQQARVSVEDRGDVKFSDLIWNINEFDVDNENIKGKHIIAWGKIKNVGQDAVGNWYINQDIWVKSKGSVTVPIIDIAATLQEYREYGLQNFYGTVGWYFIAFGFAGQRLADGKIMLHTENGNVKVLRAGRPGSSAD